MTDRIVAAVRRNAYVDSVTLLQVSAEMVSLAGVLDAALVMASELNRQLLSDSGLLVGEADSAGPNDLVIAVRAADDSVAAAALQQADALLTNRRRGRSSGAPSSSPPRSLRSAHRADPEANLVMGRDCGTAILNGVGLGFANGVRRGRIGLLGASGPDIQEVSSLLHQAG